MHVIAWSSTHVTTSIKAHFGLWSIIHSITFGNNQPPHTNCEAQRWRDYGLGLFYSHRISGPLRSLNGSWTPLSNVRLSGWSKKGHAAGKDHQQTDSRMAALETSSHHQLITSTNCCWRCFSKLLTCRQSAAVKNFIFPSQLVAGSEKQILHSTSFYFSLFLSAPSAFTVTYHDTVEINKCVLF